ESQQADDSKVQPVVARDFTSGIMHGYVELYSDAVEALNGATVMLEIAEKDDGRALDGAAAKIMPASPEAPKRRIAEGSISLGLLPPGDYVARAIINIDGRKAGQVSRPLRVGRTATPTRTTSAATLRPSASRPAPIP